MIFIHKKKFVPLRNRKITHFMPSLKAVGGSESDSEMEDVRHGDGLSDLKEKLTNLNLRTGRFNKRSSISFSL